MSPGLGARAEILCRNPGALSQRSQLLSTISRVRPFVHQWLKDVGVQKRLAPGGDVELGLSAWGLSKRQIDQQLCCCSRLCGLKLLFSVIERSELFALSFIIFFFCMCPDPFAFSTFFCNQCAFFSSFFFFFWSSQCVLAYCKYTRPFLNLFCCCWVVFFCGIFFFFFLLIQ